MNAWPAPSSTRSRRPHWMSRLTAVALSTLLVAGCATSSASLSGLDGSSGYVLSAAEQNWHCGGLENAMQVHVSKIIALDQQVKNENKTVAPTLARMFSRLTDGPGTDSPALNQIGAERVIADAYNDQLRAKKCPTVDIDAKIATGTSAATVAAAAAAAKQAPSLITKSDGIKPLEAPKGNGLASTF